MINCQLISKMALWCVIFVPLNIVFVAILMRVRVRFRLNPKTSRKIYHIFIFTTAWFIQSFFGFYAVSIFAAIILLMTFDMLFIKKDKSLRLSMSATASHFFIKNTNWHIIVPFCMTAVGGILNNLWFAVYAPIGYLVVGWADAAGSLIGQNFGKRHYTINLYGKKIKKTIVGSAGVYIFSVLAITVGLKFLGISWLATLLTAVTFSLIITLVEAISPLYTDNLTMQLITGFLLWIAFR